MNLGIELIERGLVPDIASRIGIRRLLGARLRGEDTGNRTARTAAMTHLLNDLRTSPVALHSEKANEQHYELPPEFFQFIMGKYMKYSSGYWPSGVETLTDAEDAMLELTCERAELADAQTILELGCGWGSLTLWMAEHYPDVHIVALSNSQAQKDFIEAECWIRGLDNVQVITADMNDFSIDRRFDRVVSVEMFEHMRNYQTLLQRIHGWLNPGGKLFVHIFSHRNFAYPFETEGDDNWMGRYFFTGGLMPSHDLLTFFQEHLAIEERWLIDGRHYQRTCEAWLANQDLHKDEIMNVFREVYGENQASRWFQRWRMFFMACAELFGYRQGEEWGVSHYLFGKEGVR